MNSNGNGHLNNDLLLLEKEEVRKQSQNGLKRPKGGEI